ncbi:MAG TPA: CsbD family protein [Actinomycetota bacterium]
MGDKIDEAKGRLKEAAGDLTGDEDLEREGKLDRMGADVKEKTERAKERSDEAVEATKRKVDELLDDDR